MSTKPFKMPDLSQLPDPLKDMFGGMADPTALMTMSSKQVNDLLNPKPLFDTNVKLSSQAQQTIGDIAKQNQALANETNRMAEQLRRQQQEDERRANEQLKAQEEARRKKAEKQGGKLGAGADGSFILTPKITEMLQSEAWNSIVSDKERTANAEAFISDLSTQLRSMGVADAEINNEIENARKLVSANIKAYVSEMKKDGQGLIDLAGGAAVKFGGFLSQLAGVATKGWAGIANGGDMNIDRSDKSVAGFLDYIGNSLVDAGVAANNWAESFQSSAVKLKKANADFDKRTYLAANPETEVDWGKAIEDGTFFDAAGNTVKGSAAAIKRLWDNDLMLNTVADFAPQLLGTAGTGALAKQAIKPTIAKIAAAEAKGETVKLSARLLTGTVATKYGVVNNLAKLGSAERLAMGAYGTAMGVTDAGAGAYEQVMSADAATIEKHYGKTAWNNLLKAHGGDVEEAKKELASSALYSAVSGNAPIAAISSMFGIESAIGGLMARKAISDSAKQLVSNGVKGAAVKTAKWAGKSGLEALSEGVEEGYTQYQSNLGANPYTGVNPYDGVTDAAALGAFLGAASTGVMNAIDGVSNVRTRFNSTDDIIGEYVRTGYLNYDQAKVVVGRNFEEINKLYSSEDNNTSIDAIHQIKQHYYDSMVDGEFETTLESGEVKKASLLSLMTPEQRSEFKEWIRLQEGVNTNDYAPYQASKEMNAWANGSIETIRKYGNKDLTNAYRLKTGVELDQIPQERSAYTRALLDTIEYMEQVPKNLNTRQREEQYILFRTNRLNTDDNLSVEDIAGITTFAQNILGANNRRMTDEQQAAYDRIHQAAQQVQANQQVNQNGTYEQNQTSTSQPTGQGTATENAGTVAQQSFTDGARASDTLGAIAKELAATEPTGQGSNNAQSVGNDPVQQATVASNQADNTTASGASPSGNSQGLGQTPNTGYTQPTATPTSNSGQTAQQRLAGQTSQNGQPIGQIRPSATQTPVSIGSVGTAPSERNTNGGSQQTITQADVNDSFLADPANETYVKSFINVAYNDLGKFGQGITKHKADLRRLAGITDVVGGKLSTEHIDRLYDLINMPIAERTTLINNEFRTQTAINRVHNAVHYLKQNTIKAIKSAIKSQEQARRSAERAAEQQAANQALQQEREQLAERKRLEKQERDEQARLEKQERDEQARLEKQERDKQTLIDKTEVSFLKADRTATAKEQAAQKANELLADLTAQRQAIQDELSQAKASQKATTVALKAATTAFNKAVNEVTKAKTAEKRELGKEKRKGLRLAWLSRVDERNEANTVMRQAKQEAGIADKAVSTATASLSAINVKIKEAQIKARDADKVAKQARASADKIYDKLAELRPETAAKTTRPQDTDTGDIIDMVYDEDSNTWAASDAQTERQGLPYVSEQTETNERPRTQAIGSRNPIQIGFSEPSTTAAPETTAGTDEVTTAETDEVTTAETDEVTTADGATFNLQEILSGVTNKRIRNGEVPPTLNDLAPEDDTADRPTIELTINGKTHTGKLYRFRKGNRRFIAFIHDGNAYGMKAVKDGVENQDWINFGAGIGTKRVDSINAQTAISIRVLDGTPTQQDLFSQPQEQNDTRRGLSLTLSASTGSISGLKRFQDIIDDPNTSKEEKAQAANTLNNIAYSHLSDLLADIDGVTLSHNSATGLYGGAVEPSLLVNVEVDEQAEPQLRAALVKFAENFNQEQVHMRQEATGDIGRVYPDGSFNTVTYQIELNTQIDRATIDQIIADSGLFGLTVYTNKAGNSVLEFYYYGKPTDTDAINEFNNSAEKASKFVSGMLREHKQITHRAWFYAQPNITESWGAGFTIPYTSVSSGLYTQPKNQPNAVVSAVAQSLNPMARGFEQKNITKKQFAKQHAIAKDYDKAPLYDLDNPIVRRAYEELGAEVKEQYLAMPLRGVELIIGQGEPYANSTEMREDVRVNNKIKVFATTPDSFGSNPNIDYSQHPLMQDSGLTDINGQPLLMNDLFRAVHDYYAHTMSPTTFGPKGEEAAWKNHLSMIKSPWAAWALTTETRGQNSWVNFRDEVQDVPLKDRPFADQKTVLLPLKHVYTGQADIDAKLDALREELVETYGKAALQGSLAVKEKLTSDKSNQQEIDNETQQTGRVEDSNQYADTQTQDENNTDTVGDNPRTDVGQGEIPSESGRGDSTGSQASGNEATNRPVGSPQAENDGNQTQSVQVTTYPNNLTRKERNAIAEVAQYEDVPVDTVYQAIANGNISFFTGTGATSGADVSIMARELVNQEIADNVDKAVDLINRLTTAPVTKENTPSGNSLVDDYFAQNPKDKAELENYLARTRRTLEQAVNAELDKQADYAERDDYKRAEQAYEQAAQYQQELKALPANAVEMVNAYLTDGVVLKDAVNQAIRSTRPATNGFTFDSLPQGIKDILNKIWNSLKKTVAAVSMAVAVYTGSNFVVPNEAMAATPVETATVQHIVQTNDNQGKSFIVADKQAGTLTVYNAAGQELTSTPALFGKNVGDSIKSKNTTPSGRYDLTRSTNINNSAYGNSAQVLTVNGQMQTNNAGNLAIHRVLTSFPSENRVGRLNSATASDNRISHGCINVPASFYDTHLDNVGDAVVYVLPETDAGRTGVFNVNVPTTVTAVEPRMDNANAQSVEVKPSDIQSAPTTYSEPKQAPVKALAPITIAGTQPSGQVAYVAPVVVGGVTADQINVPFEVHTPAELQANGVYDTEPVSGNLRSDGGNGFNIYDIAAWLAGIGAVAKTISKRRKKKMTSKKGDKQATTDNANEETITSEQNPSGTDRNEQAQAAVDDNHNAKVNKSAKHVVKDAKAPSQKTQIADGVTRAMWIEYIASQHAFDGENVDNDLYSMLIDTMLGFEWVIDDVMRDRTIEQANDGTFADPLKWRTDISDKERAGISAKLMNFAAGATQVFDNLMTEHGIARVGHEMDSSIPSKHLAQIKAKASGAYAQLHKLYVKPLVLKVDRLAGDLRMGYVKLEQDIGRVATVKHVLNEAADAMWRGREHIIRTHQEQLEAVNQAIANTADGNEIRLVLTSKARLLQNEIKEQTELLNRARDMYNGVIPWDGKTGLPGGYTKAQAEKVLAGLKAKYGDNFSKVEQMATETVQTIRSIRNFATAAGVFSNADLRTFNELGFTEYVPLYAEQKDPLEVDETNTYTKQSIMDRLTADLPNKEARAMGLTKDLSRYHREGATSPAADAFTNMKVFSMNMAGRIGQQGWVNSVQQLYEGTVGKPISATAITDEELLKELNASHDSGKLPGLIRVRPGMEQYVGIDRNKLKPIVAKGHNAYGEVVTYHYYFTEPAIQAEIYSNSDLNETLAAKGLRNVGTLTRFAARMMTTFKPVWNVYNWARDSLERISIMLMRPVKDKDGNLVNKWDLSKAYFKNLAVLASSKSAQSEIYRYLVLGETKTKLQKILHETVGEGAINLITSQTEKHSIMADLNKSTIDRLTSQVASMLGEGFNKAGAGKLKRGADKLVEMYVMRLTEVPQITTALAAYMAYQDVGVNKGETANRVRDQYDPLRTNNKVINSTSQLFPFIRSTFSGHYNLGRTLTEYWKPGTWQAPLAYMVVGTLGTMAVLTMMSGMFGDDEDGVPEIARLPIGTLMSGIPVPIGDDGVWSLPVGFGMNKLVWGIGANLWRQSMGMQTGGETAKQLLGLVVDNTSPIQAASGNIVAENPVTGMALTFTPLLAKPLMEIATNTKSFGGAKIINRETPKDQYDSEQDNFNTPETYKTWVRALRETTGIDMRPETMRHLIESYSYGPFGAIPKSIIQDQSDKTIGNVQRKGEVFGPLLTAIGADMAIQPNALDYAQQTYAMQDLRMELHKRYGVGETHSEEVYEQYAERGKRGGIIKRADVVTERAMRDKGVPEHVIQYVVNGMRYSKARQAANKNFTELSQKYYELRRQGKDDPYMRMEVQAAWDELEELTYNYVKENNRAYFEIMQQQ